MNEHHIFWNSIKEENKDYPDLLSGIGRWNLESLQEGEAVVGDGPANPNGILYLPVSNHHTVTRSD